MIPLAYILPPEVLDRLFGTVTAAVGDEYADDAKFVGPNPEELVPKAALAAAIEKRTREIRAQVVAVTVGGILTEAGIEFDVGGIFARRILDDVGARLRDADLSTRDAIRTVIDRAQAEGWTVPETAAAIKAHIVELSDSTAVQLARTDLIGTSNASAIAAARMVFEGQPSVTKRWLATEDERTRPTHVDADGQIVPLDSAFTVGVSRLDFPGDPSGPDEEVVNCRCLAPETEVSGADVTHAMRRPFEGHLYRITTAAGREMAVTAEHPVLTGSGWKKAKGLNAGDDLVCALGSAAGGGPHEHDVPARVDDLFRAFELARGAAERIDGARVDFHGDVPDGEVEVAAADGQLALEGDAAAGEQFRELVLSLAEREMRVSRDAPTGTRGSEALSIRGTVIANWTAAIGNDPSDEWTLNSEASSYHLDTLAAIVGSDDLGRGGNTAVEPALQKALDLGASVASLAEVTVHSGRSDADLVRDAVEAASGLVEIDPVVDVVRVPYRGHVYNLSTIQGCYFAGGILTANCTLLFEDEGLLASAWRGIVAAFDPGKHPHRPGGNPRGGQWAPTTETAIIQGDDDYESPIDAGRRDAMNGILGEINEWPRVAPEEGGASPRFYGAQAVMDAMTDVRLSVITVRKDGRLVGVGTYAGPWSTVGTLVDGVVNKVPVEPYLYGGTFAAIEGGGLPLFSGFVDEAVKHGAGAKWVSGNPRATKLYKRVGLKQIPKGEPYMGAFSVTAAEARVLSEDLFGLVRAPASLAASAWAGALVGAFDPAKHPHEPGGSSKGGQWAAKVGVTPFRPEDTAEGFYETEKYREFEAALDPMAEARGVTIDARERTQGFWLGEEEPSVALDVHDGEDGVMLFAEDVRERWDQDGVAVFEPNPDGADVAFVVPVKGPKVPTAIAEAGIAGATIHSDRVVIYGGEEDIVKVEALAASLDIDPADVEHVIGRATFVERR